MTRKPFRLAAAALLMMAPGIAWASSCGSGSDAFLLDWNSVTGKGSGFRQLAAAAEPVSATRSADDVAFTFSGNTNRFLSGYPVVNATFRGSNDSRSYSLAYAVDYSNNNQVVSLDLDFQNEVSDLAFQVLDIDSLPTQDGEGGFRDGVHITGYTAQGASVLPDLRIAENSYIYQGSPLDENQVVGYAGNASNGNDRGTLFVAFSAPVEKVVIHYTNGTYDPRGGYAPSSSPAPQGIALHDLSYCLPKLAEISTTKEQIIHAEGPAGCDLIPGEPDPEAQHAIPGACIEYRITATNTGGSLAEDLRIVDELNPNLLFVAAQQSGFAASGPGFGLTAPAPFQDCAGGSCTISIDSARLAPGEAGEILIRALLK